MSEREEDVVFLLFAFRKESQEMLKMAIERANSHGKREGIIQKEIEEEVETVKNFIDEVKNLDFKLTFMVTAMQLLCRDP